MPAVDIPVMRGDEATFVTMDLPTDDLEANWHEYLSCNGYLRHEGELLKIRGHLLTPRDRYPAPPAWAGLTIVDDGYIRIVATMEGIAVLVADDDDLSLDDDRHPPAADLTWADAIAAMQRIGARP